MKKIIIIILVILLLVVVGIFVSVKFFPKVIHEQEPVVTETEPLSELLVCDCCCDDEVSQVICIDSEKETLEDIDKRYKENPPVCNPDVKCQLRKLFKYCKTR